MPPIRDHDMTYEEVEEDDGMPPLVDNPNPSMTFTFLTDMRPLTFSSTEPASLEVLPDVSSFSSPPASPTFPDDQSAPSPTSLRASHGKKRDASYIPRPPNAFILFRSSFIKSQQVPGKVEGNHSTLSKIIGMYWKTLPREEREQWEAKAIIAQAEHRKRYPDWRFRPGANAMAKLKVKDGPGTNRKRYHHSRKSKDDAGGGESSMDQRCAKIADLLVEGKKGPDLEAAVKEWEGGRKKLKERSPTGRRTADVLSDSAGEEQVPGTRPEVAACESPENDAETAQDSVTGDAVIRTKDAQVGADSPGTTVKSPSDVLDNNEVYERFDVPLTSMFRRSLSAPASRTRDPDVPPSLAVQTHVRRDTVSFPVTAGIPQPLGLLTYQRQNEALMRRDGSNNALDSGPPSRPLPLSFADSDPSTRWNDLVSDQCRDVPVPFSTATPGFSYDASPTPSSSTFKEIYSVQVPTHSGSRPRREGESQGEQAADLGMTYSVYRYNSQVYSSYSTLKGWAGDDGSRGIPSQARGPPFTYPSSSAQGLSPFPNTWPDPTAMNTTTASSSTSGLPHPYRMDPRFGWYGPAGAGNRGLGSVRHIQYPTNLETTFDANESANTSTQTNPGTENYIFSFPSRSHES